MSQNVSAFILRRLRDWGVTRIYGYPGDGINGLLGAFHYVDHPIVRLDRTVAVLNMDMIGRNEEIPIGGGPRFNGLETQTAESNSNALNLMAFSRVPEQPKTYVQDRIRERADKVAKMLQDDNCYIYLCGLKGMEKGVIEAFRDVCREHSLDWDALKPQLLAKSRLHIETY